MTSTHKSAVQADIAETREELGGTVAALADKADVKERARHAAARTRAAVGEGLARTREKVREVTPRARAAARDPRITAAVAATAGALTAWLVARRRRHLRWDRRLAAWWSRR